MKKRQSDNVERFMTCDRCGCDIPDNENICPNCGFRCRNTTSSAQHAQITDTTEVANESCQEQSAGNHIEISKTREDEYRYPSLNYKGDGDGIPDMDLGRSTRYFNRQRTTPRKKTLWEKLVLKYRPPKDSAPDELSSAADRNAKTAYFLNVLALIGFICGLCWFLNPMGISMLLGMLCPIGTALTVLAIDFADSATEYYQMDYRTFKKECRSLHFISKALFYICFFMSLTVIYTIGLLLTGLPYAKANNFFF